MQSLYSSLGKEGSTNGRAVLLPGKPKNWPDSTDEEIAALKNRKVFVGLDQEYSFVDNRIKTSKYEPWTFLVLFLLEEFNPYTKVANLYFLCIAILQCIKAISNTNGLPTFLIPLSMVVAIDAMFQAFEDWSRHRADHVANETPANVFIKNESNPSQSSFKEIPRSKVQVGDIVRIDNRKEIPADCILLSVAEKAEPAQGLCFVETKQLDGETNLKSRAALANTLATIRTPEALSELVGLVEMEHPNKLIDSFMGSVKFKKNTFFDAGPEPFKAKQAVQPNNILLRGCILRNTDYVYALVVNTGHDTKIMMSSRGAKPKSSILGENASHEIEKIIAMLLCFCLFGAIGQAIWNSKNHINTIWYLDANINSATNFLTSFGYFFLLHASCIPVSLYVSMTIIRGGQTYFMNSDLTMYYAKTDTPAMVRTMTLNEELGQISHIFSDKTGTLTCNIMDFRKMSVNGISYGLGITEIGKASWKLQGKIIPDGVLEGEKKAREAGVPFVSFYCPDYEKVMLDFASEQRAKVQTFFRILSMCHDVIPERLGENIKLSASNPDDECLVAASTYFGFQFCDRQEGNMILKTKDSGEERIKLLETLKFTSKRKRMSVIIREADNSVKLLIKGADTAIAPRVSVGQEDLLSTTVTHMEQYSGEGLRCLLLGYKDLTEAQWTTWNAKYQKATTDLEQLEALKKGEPNAIEDLESEIEEGITLVGSTAIEDKLQDGVPECIAQLADAGINLWVLTGDKEETAINIAVACNLVLPAAYMDHIIINEKTAPTITEMIVILAKELDGIARGAAARVKNPKPKALIIDGPSLILCLDKKSKLGAREKLLELSKHCRAVVGCRVSPDQKREMVDLIKVGIPGVRTLAIGDGANDVSMIQEAHIGVGIKGEEGLQAVNSSDYAIAQFRYLSILLLKHGRYNYIRMSNLVCYVFYKNILQSITMFWFNFYSGFSGQKMFAEGAIQMFNLLFTSIPILIYGSYDHDISFEVVAAHPKLYMDGVRNLSFNTKVFWSWISTGLLQSIFMCLMPFLIYETDSNTGSTVSFWSPGALSYTAVIFMVNMKLFSFQSCWAWGNYAILMLSIGGWWLFASTLTLNMDLSQFDWYNIFLMIVRDGAFWTGLLWLLVCSIIYEVAIHGFWRAYYYNNVHILQEIRPKLELELAEKESIEAALPPPAAAAGGGAGTISKTVTDLADTDMDMIYGSGKAMIGAPSVDPRSMGGVGSGLGIGISKGGFTPANSSSDKGSVEMFSHVNVAEP